MLTDIPCIHRYHCSGVNMIMSKVFIAIHLMMFLHVGYAVQLCSTDLPVTRSVEILTTCEDSGIEVTWQPLPGSAVKLIQLEYRCREATPLNQEMFNTVSPSVLLSSSISISGARTILYSVSPGSQMECEISGCTSEGWFAYSYAIPPIYHFCNMSTLNHSSPDPKPTQQFRTSPSTDLGSLVTTTSSWEARSQLLQPSTTIFPRSSIDQRSTPTPLYVSPLISTNMPTATTTEVPSYNTTEVPSSTTAEVPSSTTAEVPSSNTAEVPSSTTAEVPSSTTVEVPSSATTKGFLNQPIQVTLVVTPTILITCFSMLLILLIVALSLTLFLVVCAHNKRIHRKTLTSMDESSLNYSSRSSDEEKHIE